MMSVSRVITQQIAIFAQAQGSFLVLLCTSPIPVTPLMMYSDGKLALMVERKFSDRVEWGRDFLILIIAILMRS
jgi:hypothetical protein